MWRKFNFTMADQF